MAWALLDDGWWCHPKLMDCPLSACGLWAKALSWSCAQRTPIVPMSFALMVGAVNADWSELVKRGLWIEAEGGWEIHEWAERQERSLSEKRAEAGRKGGEASGRARQEASSKQTVFASEANGQAGPSSPFPPLPNPSSSSAAEAVDNVYDEVAAMRTKSAKEAGKITGSATRYQAAVRKNLPDEIGPKVVECLGLYDEPPHRIAQIVEGSLNGRNANRRAS